MAGLASLVAKLPNKNADAAHGRQSDDAGADSLVAEALVTTEARMFAASQS